MEITGNALQGARYDVAVAAKQLQSTREQGQQAVQLIQSATASAPSAPGVGTRLNVVA
ncbi:MAG TPA: hypothetical protein VMG12_27845 [Polyangiaceae bacterium]|nr:hypothetical protein [Polyangiaceae bacterium]